MKSLSLVAALAVGSVVAVPALDKRVAQQAKIAHLVSSFAQTQDLSKLDKRQSNAIANLVNQAINPQGGRVAAPSGSNLPLKVEMTSRTKIDGAKTIKMRYGPYKTPSMKYKNILGEEGALWNYGDNVAPKPCDECTIVGMSAGLEYPDGRNANIDTDMWLHHMVLFNVGPGRMDATCSQGQGLPGGISLPHMLVGSSPTGSERLFSSGNERTVAVMPGWGQDNVGYKLKKEDKFALIVDLMNESMADKVTYLTLTFDIIPGLPAQYDDMKPVWFDVAQCLTSEWAPPYMEGNYTIPSTIWKANFDGEVVGAAGHLHDGGQRVILEVDGKQVCNSEATYGSKPEFISKAAMGHAGSATVHISNMSLCINDKFGIKNVVKGQKWKLKAEYDYSKNKGDLHGNGKQSTVMGIAIMFVRIPNGRR